MTPSFLLAQLYSEGSLARSAHSALPGAPVRPDGNRARLRWPRRTPIGSRAAHTPRHSVSLDGSPA